MVVLARSANKTEVQHISGTVSTCRIQQQNYDMGQGGGGQHCTTDAHASRAIVPRLLHGTSTRPAIDFRGWVLWLQLRQHGEGLMCGIHVDRECLPSLSGDQPVVNTSVTGSRSGDDLGTPMFCIVTGALCKGDLEVSRVSTVSPFYIQILRTYFSCRARSRTVCGPTNHGRPHFNHLCFMRAGCVAGLLCWGCSCHRFSRIDISIIDYVLLLTCIVSKI